MTFDSPSLIRRLRELEQQIADVPRHTESLRAAFDADDVLEAVCTHMDAERHVRAMAVTTGHIKALVIPADGLGVGLESLSELVLRAVRLVVLTELNTLRDVMSAPSARGRSRALFQGHIQTIDDLTSSLRDELDRIVNHWSAYRRMADIERAVYRAALRAAHASMRQLGTTSEAARFLREGGTCADWPALQEVCAHMLAVLTIRIDVDPDLPLLVLPPPSHDPIAERTP